MRKIITLSAMLLMCVLSFAQQALWGGAAVISPEIHENNTVSFRLKAPKAVRVQVTRTIQLHLPGRRTKD